MSDRHAAGFDFWLEFPDSRRQGLRWARIMGAGAGCLYQDFERPGHFNKIAPSLLRQARVQLEREGHLTEVVSWDLPLEERMRTIVPTRVLDVRLVWGGRDLDERRRYTFRSDATELELRIIRSHAYADLASTAWRLVDAKRPPSRATPEQIAALEAKRDKQRSEWLCAYAAHLEAETNEGEAPNA